MMMPESYPFSSSLQVLCEHGALEYHLRAGGRSVEMGTGVSELVCYPNDGAPFPIAVSQHDPYEAEIEYFVNCVETGAPATHATPSDARLALAVALAARTSLERGGALPVTGG